MFGCCTKKTKKMEDMTEGRLSIIRLTTLCVGALLALFTRKEDRKALGLLAIIGLLVAALSTYGPVENFGITFSRGEDDDDFDYDDFETESCCDGNCNCGDDCSCGDDCTCNCGENDSDFELESD